MKALPISKEKPIIPNPSTAAINRGPGDGAYLTRLDSARVKPFLHLRILTHSTALQEFSLTRRPVIESLGVLFYCFSFSFSSQYDFMPSLQNQFLVNSTLFEGSFKRRLSAC